MTTKISIKDKAINTTYTGVTGTTSGTGTGALFDVTKTNGVYTIDLNAAGTGYVAGDTITILGASLGGTAAHNLIITVGTSGLNGAIATFGSVGTGQIGDGVLDVVVDVEGTAGVDVYKFQGESTDFSLVSSATGIVATSTLLNHVEFNLNAYERVEFDDIGIAFDTLGQAGSVYALLAAAVGVTDVTADFMAQGLGLAAQGLTRKQMAAAIVNSEQFAQDAGGVSNETFVKNVFLNVVGRASTLAETAHYVGVLERGNQTKADLLVMASNVEDFQTAINLVGLQVTGIEYTV